MAVLVATVAVSAGPAGADIIKGTLSFANNAFADDAVALANTDGITTQPPGLTIAQAVCGSDLSSFTWNFKVGVIEIGFLNHQLTNQPGPDLAIFEAMELNDEFKVAVFMSDHDMQTATGYLAYAPTYLGIVDGFAMNVALVDLSDFAVAAAAEVSWIRILSEDPNSVEIAGAGAHPVAAPEPSTMVFLVAGGLAAILGRRLRRAA